MTEERLNVGNVFDIISEMIIKYEEYTNKKPYIILISKKCFDYIIKKFISMDNYFEDIDTTKEVKNIYGIPIEISNYINCEAICMNEENYKDYCRDKFNLEICLKHAQDLDYKRAEIRGEII